MAFTFQVLGFKTVENGLEISVNWNGSVQGMVVQSKQAALDYLQAHPPDAVDLFWIIMKCWQAHDPSFANPSLILNKTLTFDPTSTTAPMTIA